tara:strand:- start:4349 stop:5917 length:1569 start_codon:yes stop_codon:yes gene_type:complete
MATLSSLTGGGSSGGGGDPSGKFQASATVANGDLVVLNDNGTVAPVTSVDNAANMAASNNGTKIYAGNSGNNYSMPHSQAVHDLTGGYIFVTNEGSGNIYHRIKYGTYNSGTGEFSLTNGGTISGYSGMLSPLASPLNGYLYGYGATNGGGFGVRGVRRNASNSTYAWTGERAFNDNNTTNGYSVYISASGEGSSNFVAMCVLSTNYLAATHGTWDGTSSTPTRTQSLGGSNQRWDAGGGSWSSGWIRGCHVKDDVHVVMIKNTSDYVKFVAVNCSASATSFGTVTNTNLQQQSGYSPSMAYDPVQNIGVASFKYDNQARLFGFSVNPTTLAVTFHGQLFTTFSGSDNTAELTFNPIAKKFVAVAETPTDGPVKTFEYKSGGLEGSTTTLALHPTGTNLYCEEAGLFPVKNSGNVILTFKSGTNPTSNYIDASNHIYATQFGLPYVATNIDNHFGEAKEAISSGAAGSVGILNRTKDISGSSFQKGQKLFANPSGTALATSGTYRVGHATDGDSVLVLGDPS